MQIEVMQVIQVQEFFYVYSQNIYYAEYIIVMDVLQVMQVM